MEGGLLPVWPAAARLSEHVPAGVVVANPENVAKSSRSWQIESLALLMVNTQEPVVVGV